MTEPSTPSSAAELSLEALHQALITGARAAGWLPKMAAVHLLTFTELNPRQIGAHIDLETSPDGELLAYPDWAGLLADTSYHRTSTTNRLLQLAASYAIGAPVNLYEAVSGFGKVGKTRVTQAAAIATGLAEFERIVELPDTYNAPTSGGPDGGSLV